MKSYSKLDQRLNNMIALGVLAGWPRIFVVVCIWVDGIYSKRGHEESLYFDGLAQTCGYVVSLETFTTA